MARKVILCDTDVFLRFFHGHKNIVQEIDDIGYPHLAISSVSIGEIYFGMRKGEVRYTKEAIRKFTRYDVTVEISKKFTSLMLAYRNQRLHVADAMIASIAIVNNSKLFTINRKHFDYIEGLDLYNPRYQIA